MNGSDGQAAAMTNVGARGTLEDNLGNLSRRVFLKYGAEVNLRWTDLDRILSPVYENLHLGIVALQILNVEVINKVLEWELCLILRLESLSDLSRFVNVIIEAHCDEGLHSWRENLLVAQDASEVLSIECRLVDVQIERVVHDASLCVICDYRKIW